MRATMRAPRVVVGISHSLTGLRALREGVSAARERGLELHVVRTYGAPGPDPYYSGPAGAPGCPAPGFDGSPRPFSPRAERECAARESVHQAFAMALGGIPRDLTVNVYTRQGDPRRVLVNVAYDENDLLIVGASRRRPFRRSLSTFVAGHASCPVLVVPPSAAAHELDTRGWVRRWAQRRALPRELSELTGR